MRVLNSINRVEQEFFPTQINYTMEMKDKIKKLLDTKENEIERRLDNHIKYLFLNDKTRIDKENGIQYDIWGAGFDLALTEGFHVRYHPLIESDDLTKYMFPEPEDRLLQNIKEIDYKKENSFLIFHHTWTLFERCWTLRGYENTLMDFYDREKEIN